MEQGQFCFLNSQYYQNFPDKHLMRNKEVINGISHDRPCFLAFSDKENSNIYWLVPISSKIEKYKAIALKKTEKYGVCNTIRFGTVLSKEAAFLIQNMCPVTDRYIQEIYKDQHNNPIYIDNRIVADVVKHAQEVLAKNKRGANLIFPDVKTIYNTLVQQLELSVSQSSNLASPMPIKFTSIKDRLNAAKQNTSSQQALDNAPAPQVTKKITNDER